MRGKNLIAFIALILLAALSCSPKESGTSSAKLPGQVKEGQPVQPAGKESWETRWEITLQSARKEGKVVIYPVATAATLREAASLFHKKYGIEIEVFGLDRGAALVAKLVSERKAGLYLADIYHGGTNTFFGQLKPEGLVDPLENIFILPEVVDPKNWFGEKLPWGDKERTVFMAYAYPNANVGINTELVKPGEIKSYYDLLTPQWSKKIIMNDPTQAGTGLKSFSVLAFHTLNLDYFRQLAKQEPVVLRDQRLQVDWLAKGKYPVVLFPRTAPMTEYKEAGAPVSFVLTTEGTFLTTGSGSIALINKAPHPNAAKVFINWYLSREGQSLFSRTDGLQSAREDVLTEGIEPLKLRQPGAKYFLADSEEWLARDREFVKAAKDIFGQMIR